MCTFQCFLFLIGCSPLPDGSTIIGSRIVSEYIYPCPVITVLGWCIFTIQIIVFCDNDLTGLNCIAKGLGCFNNICCVIQCQSVLVIKCFNCCVTSGITVIMDRFPFAQESPDSECTVCRLYGCICYTLYKPDGRIRSGTVFFTTSSVSVPEYARIDAYPDPSSISCSRLPMCRSFSMIIIVYFIRSVILWLYFTGKPEWKT